MIEVLGKWYRRYLSEEESVLLLALLAGALAVLMLLGDVLAPVFVAIVLAYLMQGVANQLQLWGLPQRMGVWISSLLFTGVFFAFTLGLMPLVWRQLASLVREIPDMVERGRELSRELPADYTQFLSQSQIDRAMSTVQDEVAVFGQLLLTKRLT